MKLIYDKTRYVDISPCPLCGTELKNHGNAIMNQFRCDVHGIGFSTFKSAINMTAETDMDYAILTWNCMCEKINENIADLFHYMNNMTIDMYLSPRE